MRWNSLEMGQRSSEPPPCFRNPKVWSKAITVRSKNSKAIGWIFKELLGPAALGATEGKARILPPRSSVQLPTHGVSPQDPRTFQTDLGSLDLSYRESTMEQMFGCWFANLVMWGPSLWSQPQGKLRVKNDLQASAFKQCEMLSTHLLVNLSSFMKGKASTKSVFSGLCIAGAV